MEHDELERVALDCLKAAKDDLDRLVTGAAGWNSPSYSRVTAYAVVGLLAVLLWKSDAETNLSQEVKENEA